MADSAKAFLSGCLFLLDHYHCGAGNALVILVTAVANTASITLPDGIFDTTLTNNTSSIPLAVGVTNLSITKSNGSSTVMAGAQATYTGSGKQRPDCR